MVACTPTRRWVHPLVGYVLTGGDGDAGMVRKCQQLILLVDVNQRGRDVMAEDVVLKNAK